MERHWEAELDFLSNPYSEPVVDTYTTVLTDDLAYISAAAPGLLTRRARVDGQRKMSLISALKILMKSCRLLMVKSQNQRSK